MISTAAAEGTGLDSVCFPVGEDMTYRLYWSFLPVGKTRVTSEWVEEGGRRLIVIKYRTKTNRIVEKLYPVDDYIEVAADPVTFLPVRFHKKLSRRKVVCDEYTEFDYEQRKAHWRSLCGTEEREIELSPELRELVTFMYSLRCRPFEPGQDRTYDVIADGNVGEVRIRTHGYEDVDVPLYGSVNSIKVQPEAKFKGIFDFKGNIFAWVSTDERRVCTRLVADVAVGTVKAVLCEVHGPGEDRWIKERPSDRAPCADDPEVEESLQELEPETQPPSD